MDLAAMNHHLSLGEINIKGLFPHLDALNEQSFAYTIDFGLQELPAEPGILLIRGARQYGKSTWLEAQIYETIKTHGAGCAYYINGDYISDADHLERVMIQLLDSFSPKQKIRRIFIDEITAINKWETTLKRLADKGMLQEVLVVTTGSKATDLRRGSERLPGRKGKLERSNYFFTPLGYPEFKRVCGNFLKNDCLIPYLLSGGSPIACTELVQNGVIPEYVIELVRDWVEGEVAASGRSRVSMLNIFSALFRMGSSPIGQSNLAKEAGLANNTVAAGYMELFGDLACILPSFPWDQHRNIGILRRPCKFHFTNILVAIAYHPARIRRVQDFQELSTHDQALFYEWLVAQELVRRRAIRGEMALDPLYFWENAEHEMDFVVQPKEYLEVKRGQSSPIEFAWAKHQFPKSKVRVICSTPFESESVTGISLEQFLSEPF
ncbi:MAG: ATP-binding protein [Verrucomicrobia bacterium]|nr:ATP-binding protein [Verrucomicrobiota bacterium]